MAVILYRVDGWAITGVFVLKWVSGPSLVVLLYRGVRWVTSGLFLVQGGP